MSNNNFWNSFPPVTKHLIVLNVVIWIFSFALYNFKGVDLADYLGMHFPLSEAYNPLQLITYMFMHDSTSISHVFFNMFSLFMFGKLLEQVMGSTRFALFYLTCGIGAAALQLLVCYFQIQGIVATVPPVAYSEVLEKGLSVLQEGKNYIDPALGELNLLINTPMVGASGAVFGVLLAFGMLFPNIPLYLFFIPIPIKAKYMVIGYGALELLFGVSGAMPGVAHFAHLGGMVFGLLIILYWRKKGVIRKTYY